MLLLFTFVVVLAVVVVVVLFVVVVLLFLAASPPPVCIRFKQTSFKKNVIVMGRLQCTMRLPEFAHRQFISFARM